MALLEASMLGNMTNGHNGTSCDPVLQGCVQKRLIAISSDSLKKNLKVRATQVFKWRLLTWTQMAEAELPLHCLTSLQSIYPRRHTKSMAN